VVRTFVGILIMVCALGAACGGGGGEDDVTSDGGPLHDGGAVDGPVIPPGRHHPLGFATPTMHGPALEHGAEDCRGCHGQDLTGNGDAPSCDGCHQAGWRTTCVYCHGGTDNQTGAPPRQLGGDTGGGSFPPHTAHVETTLTTTIVCGDCHKLPTDVLSSGHVFDATPGAAEVDFSHGRDPGAVYSAGTCSSSKCHGNGRTLGTITRNDSGGTCSFCHIGYDDPGNWDILSGRHAFHLEAGGLGCADCHGTVTSDSSSISGRSLHLDGAVAYTGEATFNPATQHCTGSCHGHTHNDNW
jgi:hypothetical protein